MNAKPTKSGPLIVVLFAVSFCHSALALKRLHTIPTSAQANSAQITVLHGTVLAVSENGKRDAPYFVNYAAELKKDVLVWDELKQDELRITECSRHSDTLNASIRIAGSQLDPSDFKLGASFVINVDDWEENCQPVEPASGIDEADDALFYVIEEVSKTEFEVFCRLRIVSGRTVVPNVEIEVSEVPSAMSDVSRTVPVSHKTVTAKSNPRQKSLHNDTLPSVSRPGLSFSKSIKLFDGGSLSARASISADVEKFRVRRLFKTELQWEQRLRASADLELKISKKFDGATGGELYRAAIPNFGFSARIPFVGRVSAGAFVLVNWFAEIEVDTRVTMRFSAAHELRQIAQARVLPPKFSSRNLPVPRSRGNSTFEFEKELSFELGVRGFVGLRPAVSVEITLGKWGVGGNVGAKVGVEASIRARSPPFTPFTSRSVLKLGNCNTCHRLQGELSIRGKDLAIQLMRNNKVEKEVVLVNMLFKIPLGTLCALPASCPAPTPLPSRQPLPTPRLFDAQVCQLCSLRGLNVCGNSGTVCSPRTSRCVRMAKLGESCGAHCTECMSGVCQNGRCSVGVLDKNRPY